MRLVTIGTTPEEAATVVLSRSDLRAIAGGLSEALFELSESEFSIRVGLAADSVRTLLEAVVSVRNEFDKSSGDAP